MNKLSYFKMVLALIVALNTKLVAQHTFIQTNKLIVVDKKLEINYDLLKAKKNQRFEVWVDVSNSKGDELEANTFSGDVGPNLVGGAGKKIYWDYNADGLVMDEDIEVVVKAKLTTIMTTVSGGKCFFQSLIIPGMGLSAVEKGKPFWIIGIIGYGALGSSLNLNSSSKSYYDKYKKTTDPVEATTFYNKSQSQGSLSNVMAYTAIGTWSLSLIWTLVKVNQHNKSITYNTFFRNMDVYSYTDPISKKPLVGLRYHF
jgi:hypothetical protein